ncbi:MAG TPA: hypothetical protein VMH02_09705 [Verrucomicrobiae bacterium]|nr:hypothetical protein [Verrucomicrobiae bacterium]
MARDRVFALATIALFLAGCSGSGSSFSPAGGTAPEAPSAAYHAAAASPAGKKPGDSAGINAVNALGSPVKTYSDEISNEPGGNGQSALAMAPDRKGTGACHDGVEFYAPDRNGDPNSTETLTFFDSACTELARDAVRLYDLGTTAGTETVNRTVKNYAYGNATTPISVRTETTNFYQGTFGKNGFPVVAGGFVRETSSDLAIGTRKNVISDTETVMQSSTTAINDYCTDSAGYNSIGIARLDESFGWDGGAYSGGARTRNDNGSVTWSATHTGATESAPIGAFSIATGAYNAGCPISTPAYTLAGGTVKGSYTIPIVVTFTRGVVSSLTVTNASLSSGDTLNVATNAAKPPSKPGFITGTVTNGSATVAIFDVNAYGDGTLTIASNGHQFPISDWNVVR